MRSKVLKGLSLVLFLTLTLSGCSAQSLQSWSMKKPRRKRNRIGLIMDEATSIMIIQYV